MLDIRSDVSLHFYALSSILTFDNYTCLVPSVLGRISTSILLIYRFSTASETHVLVKIAQTLAINLLTSIDPA